MEYSRPSQETESKIRPLRRRVKSGAFFDIGGRRKTSPRLSHREPMENGLGGKRGGGLSGYKFKTHGGRKAVE